MAIARAQIIDAALSLLDDVGIEGLTMRRLATRLDIKAASLYWHVANKGELLESMADALLEQVACDEAADESWDNRLHRIASDMRRALLQRRDGARVFAGTYPASPNVIRVGNVLIEGLIQAGLDERKASWGAFTLLYFVLGFAIEEQALDEQHLASLPANPADGLLETYPLAAMAIREITESSADDRFHFGLDAYICGMSAYSGRT